MTFKFKADMDLQGLAPSVHWDRVHPMRHSIVLTSEQNVDWPNLDGISIDLADITRDEIAILFKYCDEFTPKTLYQKEHLGKFISLLRKVDDELRVVENKKTALKKDILDVD